MGIKGHMVQGDNIWEKKKKKFLSNMHEIIKLRASFYVSLPHQKSLSHHITTIIRTQFHKGYVLVAHLIPFLPNFFEIDQFF